MARDEERFSKKAFRLAFTSNHDENSWAGTEFEREGIYADACAILCATLPHTQLLVYTGQEIGLDRRLEFFEKDPITDWSPNAYTEFWKKLIQLKHSPVLAAGERGGDLVWWEVPVPDTVVAFSRELKDNQVIVIANFGKEPYAPTFNIPDVTYTNCFTGEKVEAPYQLNLAPGEYVVLTR